MIDLMTKLTMSLGKNIHTSDNILDESSSDNKWKYDVVIQFITLNINNSDTVNKAVELSKNLGLEHQDSKYWKDVILAIKYSFNKDKETKQAAKTVRKSVSSYGCGTASDYGCGGRSSSDYGCGGRSSSRYGC